MKLLGQIQTLYGGRIAEQMLYGEDGISTGASSDIQMATRYARAMVTQWGFADEKLGPIQYSLNEQTGREDYSVATGELIDKEVKRIIDQCYQKAEQTLAENKDILHAMKEALMEYETLDSDQVADLMQRKPVRQPKDWDKPGPGVDSESSVDQGSLDQAEGDGTAGDADPIH